MICAATKSVSESRRKEGVGGTHVEVERSGNVDLVRRRIKVGMTSKMTPDDKLGEHLVDDGVGSVLHDTEDVEPGEDGFGEFDVLAERDRGVVASSDRVGGGDDGAASLEGRDDSSLGDGDALLLHRLVNRRPACRSSAPALAHRRKKEEAHRSASFILSNSSIMHTPLSASTSAPPSSVHSLVTGSFLTLAVNPTALAP